MRPGIATLEREIIGIGDRAARRLLRLGDLISDAVALAISDGLLEIVEAQPHLLHACRPSWSSPSAARSRAAARARNRAPIPWSWRCRTASRSSPACRCVPSWSRRLCSLSKCRGMVGAAGFEPATWSTQNSRATRLRYAPALPRGALDTRFGFGQQAWPGPSRPSAKSYASAEDRMRDAVAGGDAELPGGAGDHLQHGAHRPAGGDQRFRERHGVLGDAQDASVGADEDHVERDIGVLHPEAGRLLASGSRTACPALPAARCRNIRPFACCSGVTASSTAKTCTPFLRGDLERLQFLRGGAAAAIEPRQHQERKQRREQEQDDDAWAGLDRARSDH